jgi:hypothetical protein
MIVVDGIGAVYVNVNWRIADLSPGDKFAATPGNA